MKRWIALSAIAVLIIISITGWLLFIKTRSTSNEIVLYGNVDVRQVDIGFRVPGQVEKMCFEEGDLVRKGTFMTSLDEEPYKDEVLKAEANLLALRKSLLNAEETLQRRKNLIEEGGVSEEDLTNALTNRDVLVQNVKQAEAELGIANTRLEDTKRFAPTDGVILTRVREPGAVVRESDPVYTLSIKSPVWVRAYVSEPDLGNIQFDMPALVYTDTKGVGPYKGHIGFISPVAEFTPKSVETTRLRVDLVYRIRVVVDNPDENLKQGMPVTVKIFPNKYQNHAN